MSLAISNRAVHRQGIRREARLFSAGFRLQTPRDEQRIPGCRITARLDDEKRRQFADLPDLVAQLGNVLQPMLLKWDHLSSLGLDTIQKRPQRLSRIDADANRNSSRRSRRDPVASCQSSVVPPRNDGTKGDIARCRRASMVSRKDEGPGGAENRRLADGQGTGDREVDGPS